MHNFICERDGLRIEDTLAVNWQVWTMWTQEGKRKQGIFQLIISSVTLVNCHGKTVEFEILYRNPFGANWYCVVLH